MIHFGGDYLDISEQQLHGLITCPKTIIKRPKKEFYSSNGCLRNDFTAQSTTNEHFRIFMRQNLCLLEDYSIGLIWECQDNNEDIIICRFNGPHGGNRKINTHFVTHIHKLNVELAKEDIFKENDVSETKDYATFADAIYTFCEYCHISEALKYFPEAYSLDLF